MRVKNLLVILFLLSIFGVSFVTAATTINTPAASTTVGGSTTFNVTFTDFVFGTNDLINLTFYASSTLTANSSFVQIGTNNSLNGTLLSNESITTIDLTGLIEDANNYIFNVTSTNSTGGTVLSEDTNTGITVDNTIPQAATSLSPADNNVDTDGSVTFSGTVTGANTTSCTLRFVGTNPGLVSQAMTHSGNSCTVTLSNIAEQTYLWFIRASDETNTTDSATQTQVVDLIGAPKGAGNFVKIAGTESIFGAFSAADGDGVGGGSIIGIGVIVLIIGGAIYLARKK